MSQDRLLLITGAGASHQLSVLPDEPLPLMSDWAERLRQKLGAPMSQMAGLDEASDGIEFEETLGALFRWLDTLPLAERFRRLSRPAPDLDESHPEQFRQLLGMARKNGDRFVSRLHESLFEEFGPERVDEEKAVAAYAALFRTLGFSRDGQPPESLICATTNYDRSLEMALEGARASVRTGFRAHGYRTPVLEPVDLGVFDPAQPAILYLHGAVGWYRSTNGAIVSMPADQGYNSTLGRPAVLYPGPDKDIARSETVELWQEFERALEDATHVFVLGHGLNDAHLVSAIKESPARVAVSYRVANRATEPAAQDAEKKEARIKRVLPRSIPVAAEFGPEPSFDRRAIKEWRRPIA